MIYLLESAYKDSEGYHDSIKIGYCYEPFEASRKLAYDTHNFGYKFLGEKEGSRSDEGNLQWLFRDDLLRGEWFKSSPEKEFIFKNYSTENWGAIKSLYSLCRDIPVVTLWARILKVDTKDWIKFLWKLSLEFYKLGIIGEKKLYDYVVWGPNSSNQLPTRKILREVLEKVGGIGLKILPFIEDVETLNVSFFDSQFLFTLRSEFNLPCYSRLFREYCEFLSKFPERNDVRCQFYDPRPKLVFEKLGIDECRKENFNLEKLYEKLYN